MYNRPKLGEILVQKGVLNSKALEQALQEQEEQTPRLRLGALLIQKEIIDPWTLAQALGEQFDLDVQEHFDIEEVDLNLSKDLSYAFAKDHGIMPIRLEEELVYTAITDPLDVEALDVVRAHVGAEPYPILGTPEAVGELIAAVFDRRGDLDQLVDELDRDDLDGPSDLEDAVEKIEDLLARSGGDDEGPIIQLVNTIFQQSVRDRASDIHIEPMEEYVLVRFRIDGVLKEVIRAPKRFQNSIVVRIKIMANLNIAEKRLPQDGRIRFRIAGRDIDVRVATAPSAFGERITMRLLDRQAILLDLTDLGLTPHNAALLKKSITQPHGIILVTGPTGSGKSTTLYACLNYINTPDKNILTVEDPVEYQLKGISQMQVNPKIDLTFASGLRSYLRHDPDVIMVGEIRDVETAEIAIQAALTGHLVLSTIHTNDSAGAFSRLIDMGIEPFLVSSSLTLSLAQRLVRKLCTHCRVPYRPSSEELDQLKISLQALEAHGGHIYRPSQEGCQECRRTGYAGRTAIYEMLEVTNEIRQLVMKRTDAGTIRKLAIEQGMTTMRDDGAIKVLQGVTSISEVLRVTQDESH